MTNAFVADLLDKQAGGADLFCYSLVLEQLENTAAHYLEYSETLKSHVYLPKVVTQVGDSDGRNFEVTGTLALPVPLAATQAGAPCR